MSIPAELVRKLREQTGAGMMDCKAALLESNGDLEGARELLRRKGLAAAAKRAARAAVEGIVGSYVHPLGGKIGVLVEVDCETDFVAKTPEFQALVKDIAMHIAAATPSPVYVAKDDVPAEVLEKEKQIYRAQAAEQGKPPAVVDKIAEGKLKEFYQGFCLLEQPFIKDGKLTVGQLIQEKIALIKENIVVRRFARFRVGEDPGAGRPATE